LLSLRRKTSIVFFVKDSKIIKKNNLICGMLELKKELYTICLNIADQRIQTAENAIIAAREAAENDTKSSAGDKYETTREMMQQEISRNEVQLLEARKLKQSLMQINPEKTSKTVQAGSLVTTNNGIFFLTIAAGKLRVDEKDIFAISPASPVGLVLKGLKAGESCVFNSKEYKSFERLKSGRTLRI
jgi:transcription elongation GreA/GreB family factor